MIRTGTEYRDSLRDSREVFINGERVKDLATHPSFKVTVRSRGSGSVQRRPIALRSERNATGATRRAW